ncbi:MAG TPA: lipocalin family protein [Albitalea sp.]|nr:lipocalin family protein [Albitalea sp.]
MVLGDPRKAVTRLAGAAAVAAWMAFGAATASPPVRSVPQLDPLRYAGVWYEMARLPNSMQARCVADVTAAYRVMDDGSMTVVHRCLEADDHWRVIVGRASPEAGDRSGARLRVNFLPPWLRWLPMAHDRHWVVMVDDAYRVAVVSEPSRRHLWILSRTPQLDLQTYDRVVDWLRAQSYPVDQLVPTLQRPQHRAMPFGSMGDEPPPTV